VIAGLRPDDFEDAALVQEQGSGTVFRTKIDVLESMGSEFYAYFTVEAEQVTARELQELAEEAGTTDLPTQDGTQVVARLESASKVRQGEEIELWFNSDYLHLFDPENGLSLLAE